MRERERRAASGALCGACGAPGERRRNQEKYRGLLRTVVRAWREEADGRKAKTCLQLAHTEHSLSRCLINDYALIRERRVGNESDEASSCPKQDMYVFCKAEPNHVYV